MVTFLKSTTWESSTIQKCKSFACIKFCIWGTCEILKLCSLFSGSIYPKRSFQPAAFAGAAPASRQVLPSLSSLLSKSFNSQLSPANGKESLESKDTSTASVSDSPIAEEVDELGNLEFIALDVFRWRCDHILNIQDMRAHNFLEVGAAALLVGDMEAKMKGETWKVFGSADMPYLDQLLQPSLLTTVTNSASAFAHLRAITALKRSKPGANQICPSMIYFTMEVKFTIGVI
ncbi:hypothetical protein Sango_0622600, partial [Sesamum angolense]